MTSDNLTPNDSTTDSSIDHTENTPENDQLDQLTRSEVERLEQQVKELQDEIDSFQSEKERIAIEARLAIDDAELARSFSRKNYSPLLSELFHRPAKRLRRQNIILFILSIISITALIVTIVYPLFFKSVTTGIQPSTQSSTPKGLTDSAIAYDEAVNRLEKKLASIEESILQLQNTGTPAETSIETPELTSAENNIKQEIAKETATQTDDVVVSEPPQALSGQERNIDRQAKKIVSYVKQAAQQKGFPNDYVSNPTSLAQLYLIVMQHASNENIYYESYLSAMRALNVSQEIIPETIDDLVAIDTAFLQATFSAQTITQRKKLNGWRYRDSDQQFSSYYNPELNYDLGPWQIVNEEKDYKELPDIFALNTKRMVQQLLFNKRQKNLAIPDKIFYLAYAEENKNQSVKRLLSAKHLQQQNEKLVLNTQHIPLTANSQLVRKVQGKLAEQGLMSASVINGIAGPKTREAIRQYQKANNLAENPSIHLDLLSSLGITVSYADFIE